MQPGNPEQDAERTLVLEAFADTIIPGEKRTPDDRAVAGASVGGGAVAAGASAGPAMMPRPSARAVGVAGCATGPWSGRATGVAGASIAGLSITLPTARAPVTASSTAARAWRPR